MKKIMLLLFTVAFCFTAKAQTDSIQLAKNIIDAIKCGKVENLQKLVAAPAVYKAKFKETEGLTDEQIIEKTSNSPKLIADFEGLLAKAKEKKIDLGRILFESTTIDPMPGGFGVSIKFSVGEKTGKIAVSTMKHNGNWYLMEIILTSRAFRDF